MKRSIIILFVFLAIPMLSAAQDVYMFCYFKNNSADGLHLAFSNDGYKWQALNNDISFLKPAAGNDKLMRDPCIIKDAKGIFHMVWTVSWTERSIGYASSPDLVNWSAQKEIPVMADEPLAKNAWAPDGWLY